MCKYSIGYVSGNYCDKPVHSSNPVRAFTVHMYTLYMYHIQYNYFVYTELQIRRGNLDNSKIFFFFLFLNEKICCDPILEWSQ